MLKLADNELLCRVDPGTPMNEVFKRFWLPAAKSDDFPGPDSDPRRVTIMYENFVLFRDSDGVVACLRDRCCHRMASLTLGRVEECGIRCIFHGWKFDRTGKILDIPNSGDEKIKQHYRQPAFPTHEAGGLVWIYLGPEDDAPPVPDYHWLKMRPDQQFIQPVVFDANFAQVIDGGADSSHLTILHQDALKRTLGTTDQSVRDRVLGDAAPDFDVYPTDFGQFSVAVRNATDEEGNIYRTARSSAYIAPSTVLVTGGRPDVGSWGVIVPVTNTRSIFWIGFFSSDFNEETRQAAMHYMSIDNASLDELGSSREMCDKPGKAGPDNNWMQDRDAMRTGERFSGLKLFIPEDIAVAESMGGIVDRSEELLVKADLVIVSIRRTLLEMARSVRSGEKPLSNHRAVDTSKIYCREVALAQGEDWKSAALPPEFQVPQVQDA